MRVSLYILFEKIEFLQNKAVKNVGGEKYCKSATPFYFQLKIFKFVELISLETALFVFKTKKQTLPVQL